MILKKKELMDAVKRHFFKSFLKKSGKSASLCEVLVTPSKVPVYSGQLLLVTEEIQKEIVDAVNRQKHSIFAS